MTDPQPVAVQRVDYTYFENGQEYSQDCGLPGDLIQVVHSERCDPAPGVEESFAIGIGSGTWHSTVTQYRYHIDPETEIEHTETIEVGNRD